VFKDQPLFKDELKARKEMKKKFNLKKFRKVKGNTPKKDLSA
jgi:hypothetical protein